MPSVALVPEEDRISVEIELRCPNCGDVYSAAVTAPAGINFAISPGHCPLCGTARKNVKPGPGVHSIDYLAGHLAAIVRAATPDELRLIAAAVDDTQGEMPNLTPAQVADIMEATGTTTGGSLAQWIRDNGHVLGAGAALATILQTLMQVVMMLTQPDSLTPEQVEEIIQRVVEETAADERSAPRERPSDATEEAPRLPGRAGQERTGSSDGSAPARD